MNRADLQRLAALGARARIAELETELTQLRTLVGGKQRGRPAGTPNRRKRTMSAKARAAISKAQKARWAKLRAKKAAK